MPPPKLHGQCICDYMEARQALDLCSVLYQNLTGAGCILSGFWGYGWLCI